MPHLAGSVTQQEGLWRACPSGHAPGLNLGDGLTGVFTTQLFFMSFIQDHFFKNTTCSSTISFKNGNKLRSELGFLT